MRDAVLHVFSLVYLMAPAYAANMLPPLLRFWHGWNPPIHRRWLGAHKTVLGFLAGVGAAIAITALQALAAAPLSLIAYDNWLLLGFAFGLGAMGGDALKSFLKRRLGIAPGSRWVPFDQLDFMLGALVLVQPFAWLGAIDIAVLLIVTFGGDIAVNRLSYRLGIKQTPW